MVNVRMDNDLLARLDSIAEERSMTRSDLIRVLIDYFVPALEHGDYVIEISYPEVGLSTSGAKPRRRRR